MNNDIHIQIKETGNSGHAFLGEEDAPLAEMSYSKAGKTMIIIDHTEVGEAVRGQGVGRKLLDAVVVMAREKNLKVLPLCPYARSVFDKDATIRDVLK
ncbi:MAG: GNAT family N-acetyltransferase [Bacteroidota bacterium]